MGCWNETCGVSQLPIVAGKKVKAFLITESKYEDNIRGSGTCYPMDYFVPFFLPVSASYNDYGSVEKIQTDWNSVYMLHAFREWLKDGTIENLGDDAEINNPGISHFSTLDDVFDCVERGALLYHGYKIGLFMVLDEVYQSLLSHSAEAIKLNEYSMKYERDTYEKSSIWFREFRTKPQIDVATLSPNDKLIYEIADSVDKSFLLPAVLGMRGDPGPSFDHYVPYVKDPNFGDTEEIIKRFADVRHFNSCMSYLRKMWIPQTGKGSQSQNFGFYRALNAGMSAYIGKVEKSYDEN